MPEPPIITIYCRTADQPDDFISPDEQELVCRQYCMEHSLIVGNVYQDVFSGHQ
jgi:hypothetical protein